MDRVINVLTPTVIAEFHNTRSTELRVQPRRAKGDKKQTKRSTGVGCQDSLGQAFIVSESSIQPLWPAVGQVPVFEVLFGPV